MRRWCGTVFAAALGPVRAVESDEAPRQHGGTVQPGNPWWPGSESNCSIGFGATDTLGGKHFVPAGHCTNNPDQPAYAQVDRRTGSVRPTPAERTA